MSNPRTIVAIPLYMSDRKTTHPQGFFPPVGEPVVFINHNHHHCAGEAVYLKCLYSNNTFYRNAFFWRDLAGIRRAVVANEVHAWQARKDTRNEQYGTDLGFYGPMVPYTPPAEKMEMLEQDSVFALTSPDGNLAVGGVLPPQGTVIDYVDHRGDRGTAVAVQICVNVYKFDPPRLIEETAFLGIDNDFRQYIIFPEQIAVWGVSKLSRTKSYTEEFFTSPNATVAFQREHPQRVMIKKGEEPQLTATQWQGGTQPTTDLVSLTGPTTQAKQLEQAGRFFYEVVGVRREEQPHQKEEHEEYEDWQLDADGNVKGFTVTERQSRPFKVQPQWYSEHDFKQRFKPAVNMHFAQAMGLCAAGSIVRRLGWSDTTARLTFVDLTGEGKEHALWFFSDFESPLDKKDWIPKEEDLTSADWYVIG